MAQVKKTCKAKTKAGKRCSRSAKFIFCKQHWGIKALKYIGGPGLLIAIIKFATAYMNYNEPPPIVNETTITYEMDCDKNRNFSGRAFADFYSKKRTVDLILPARQREGMPPLEAYYTYQFEPKGYSTICYEQALRLDRMECNLEFGFDKQNRFIINAKLYDLDRCLVGVIQENEFLLNEDCAFTSNHDDFAFEVVDKDFNVVLSAEIILPNSLRLRGVFLGIGEYPMVLGKNFMFMGDYNNMELIRMNQRKLKPLFKYVGANPEGVRMF